jgi:hypothetical protein
MDDDRLAYYQEREEHTAALAEQQQERDEELNEAEEEQDPARLCWENVNGDNQRCRVLTGFTCDEVLELLELCEQAIPMTTGRGKHGKWTAADKFLMMLCYVKHYETQDKLGDTFHTSKAQINRIVSTTVEAVTPILYAHFVTNVRALIPDDVHDAGEFGNAKFVMDATLQEIWTPLGTFEERKRFYSGKHKLYGLKSLTLHNRIGLLWASWSGVPGSVHDLTIAREHVDEIAEFLAKEEEEQEVEDETWAVLVDTGFVGLEHNLNALHPFKRAAGRDLTIAQRNYNRRLAGQRVICERWYGRLKTRNRIMATKYRNNRDDYATHFQLCAALSNYNVISNPL